MEKRRRVTQTGKDKDGDIVKLCNPWESWSPRWVSDVISDIEQDDYEYYVKDGDEEALIRVIHGASKKYLQTEPDSSSKNNLDNLPDC